ncbi:hypothetical protein F5877DRAFT_53782, partial [Lentinula edodes]
SIILINRKISSNVWRQIDISGTNDITEILLTGPFGKLGIFNIYNDGKHSLTLTILRHTIDALRQAIQPDKDLHVIWCGDFNHQPSEPPSLYSCCHGGG